MPIDVKHIGLRKLDMHTRMPFKYGIASLTSLPHLFVQVRVEVDGQVVDGIAAEGLPPKWFTKQPTTSFEQDLPEMIEVIESACRTATELGPCDSVFTLWWRLWCAQREWAEPRGFPPLLWGLGVSLVERGVIDAFCRARQTSFSDVLRSGAIGLELGQLHPELADLTPNSLLPHQPRENVYVRHTIGLADPLTDGEIAAEDRLEDGLPQSLEACIDAYGLCYFKVKLTGDVDHDRQRLRDVAKVIMGRCGDDFAFTLDGNEQFKEIESFRDLWQLLQEDAALRGFMARLIVVEQPLHRDVALADELEDALRNWPDRPPMIIDESDGEPASLPRALNLGYAGTSYKNCKGVLRGIANACLLEHRRRQQPNVPYILTGEDLANVGPVALLQDLATVATLGLSHVERNGHHYFRGLSMFDSSFQEQVLSAHGDLYHRSEQGFATLAITHGQLNLASVNSAPFGVSLLAEQMPGEPFGPLS